MEETLAYFKQRRPGFSERAVPASADQVDELEKVLGRALPSDYRAFLLTAGTSAGPMFEGFVHVGHPPKAVKECPLSYDFSIKTVLKSLRRQKGGAASDMIIATQRHWQDAGPISLRFREDGGADVVAFNGDTWVSLAPSFKDFVQLFAFLGKQFY